MPRDNMLKAPYVDLLALWGKSNWETLLTLLMMLVSSSQVALLNGWHRENGGFLLMSEERREDSTRTTHPALYLNSVRLARIHTAHSQLTALPMHALGQPLKHCVHTSSFREVLLILSSISVRFSLGCCGCSVVPKEHTT